MRLSVSSRGGRNLGAFQEREYVADGLSVPAPEVTRGGRVTFGKRGDVGHEVGAHHASAV